MGMDEYSSKWISRNMELEVPLCDWLRQSGSVSETWGKDRALAYVIYATCFADLIIRGNPKVLIHSIYAAVLQIRITCKSH